MPAVERRGHVDIDDIAVLQAFARVGNAVADNVIDRGADGLKPL